MAIEINAFLLCIHSSLFMECQMPKKFSFCLLTQYFNGQNYICMHVCNGQNYICMGKIIFAWANLYSYGQINISMVKFIFAWAKFYFHGQIIFPWPQFNSMKYISMGKFQFNSVKIFLWANFNSFQ